VRQLYGVAEYFGAVSEQNLKLVRALFEAVDDGDLRAAGDFMHPDFEMSQLPLHPEAGTYRGQRAARESIDAWTGTFEDFRWEAEEFIAAGDRIVVVVREVGRARGADVALDHRYGALFTIRDGRIARLQWFDDKDQALDAAGA
jgi:ketosteroid isomerase-like protein